MKNYATYSDLRLFGLLRLDDEGAFNEIFERYDRLLFIYAHKKLQDKEEAKDVVQEVFISLWNNRTNLEIKSALATYLYTAVRNKALNLFRDKMTDSKYLKSLQFFLGSADNTDYLIREKDITSLIEKEIAALPPKMREVFELRRKAYLSNKEIAERLGISELTVATHIKRALKILRSRLGLFIYLIFLLR